ncbi:hypothetical protein FKQ51_01440 [Bacillus toyonensis]|uniref:hypothetical protein n=1 Tax=Bacillus toyonensis TaxID=155322 RepID=UPI0027027AEB|nr:hypothetical protein [Bacillus toyonensis]MDO8156056.1 hypothetical protein [Bacillus toyonensis]
MKFKKTITSLLSISALAFSFGGAASAQEVSSPVNNQNVNSTMLDTTTSVAYWGYHGGPRTLDGKSIIQLDGGFSFGSGYAYSLDGYQESGSFGKAKVEYSIYEKKGGPVTSSAVWKDVSEANGYFYLSIPVNVIDPKKDYILKAENTSNIKVELRGNAYRSSR